MEQLVDVKILGNAHRHGRAVRPWPRADVVGLRVADLVDDAPGIEDTAIILALVDGRLQRPGLLTAGLDFHPVGSGFGNVVDRRRNQGPVGDAGRDLPTIVLVVKQIEIDLAGIKEIGLNTLMGNRSIFPVVARHAGTNRSPN